MSHPLKRDPRRSHARVVTFSRAATRPERPAHHQVRRDRSEGGGARSTSATHSRPLAVLWAPADGPWHLDDTLDRDQGLATEGQMHMPSLADAVTKIATDDGAKVDVNVDDDRFDELPTDVISLSPLAEARGQVVSIERRERAATVETGPPAAMPTGARARPQAPPPLPPLPAPPLPAPAVSAPAVPTSLRPAAAARGMTAMTSSRARRAKPPRRRRSISIGFTVAMLLLVCAVLFLRGWDFYPLDLDLRVGHPDYKTLRPSGTLGYAYGMTGTALIFLNLLYLARRRLARANLGSMRTWLDLHVFTGVVGAGFIIFHSAFQARSLLSMSTAIGFAIVLVTGVIGRFLYALAPRPEPSVLRDAIAALDSRLPGVGAHVDHAIRAFPIRAVGGDDGFLLTLAALPGWRRTARRRRNAIRFVVENAPAMEWRDATYKTWVRAAARKVQRAAAIEVRSVAAAALLRSWRSLHRFFALIMLLGVIVHVTVALHYGYHWIFSE
ncbi:hypothetical protein [Haliangium sp.]|uniref:hypothetical protein n=1 Tax=Haliangium sp. TaxID=2663208 RepID=UPI003D0EEDD4